MGVRAGSALFFGLPFALGGLIPVGLLLPVTLRDGVDLRIVVPLATARTCLPPTGAEVKKQTTGTTPPCPAADVSDHRFGGLGDASMRGGAITDSRELSGLPSGTASMGLER